ncbi:MAG TPA: acyl carrier protein [Candidatus Limnocylindrales bacterium]|jgi:acyl carrier protein|nr:acyl carrier protein [Candidatus Limnocylindrales bacterium]
MKPIAAILNEIRPEFDFTTSQDFMADGMLDSFDMVTLVATLDKTFSISIQGTDIIPENFKNLETIEALLRRCGVHS